MPLLAGIAIRYPDVGLVPGHGIAHDLGGAAEYGSMNDGIGRAKDLLIAIATFDPHPGLVASHDLCAAQDRKGIVVPGGKDRRCAFEHAHQLHAPWRQAGDRGSRSCERILGGGFGR